MNRTSVFAALVIVGAIVGAIDAASAGTGDLVAIFVTIAVLGALQLLPFRGRRRDISVRADLAAFLADRAAAGDESVGRVADRAVAGYRSALTLDADRSPSDR